MLLQNTFLFFHVIGLVMIAGAVVGGFVLERGLFAGLREVPPRPERALPLLQNGRVLATFAQVGGILMLITGIGMLWATHWIFWGQTWLDIKLVLYVLLIVNGAAGVGSAALKVRHALQATQPGPDGAAALGSSPELSAALARLKVTRSVEAALFLAIILLAVFKP